MTCTGSPTRTCTHKWKASRCSETVTVRPNVQGCSFSTSTLTANRTRGTGVVVGDRWQCTTTNMNVPDMVTSVVVHTAYFGSMDVRVDVAQTNGLGTFQGTHSMLDKTITVKGTFATPGDQKGGSCGAYPAPGRVDGTFQITVPA